MGQNIGVATATTTTHRMFAAKLREVGMTQQRMFEKLVLGAETIATSLMTKCLNPLFLNNYGRSLSNIFSGDGLGST